MFWNTYYRILIVLSFTTSLYCFVNKQIDAGIYAIGLTIFFQNEARN